MNPFTIDPRMQQLGFYANATSYPTIDRDDDFAAIPLVDELIVAVPSTVLGLGYRVSFATHSLLSAARPLAIVQCDLRIQPNAQSLASSLVVERCYATRDEEEESLTWTPQRYYEGKRKRNARYQLVGELSDQRPASDARHDLAFRWVLRTCYPLFIGSFVEQEEAR